MKGIFTKEFGKELLPFRVDGAKDCPIYSNNNIVTTLWSEDYVEAGKHNVKLFLDSMGDSWGAIKKGKVVEAIGHLANALVVGLGTLLFVEGLNFLKGVVGMLASAAKLGTRPFLFVGYLVAAILAGCMGKTDLAKKFAMAAFTHFGLMFKDIVSIVTCLGHSIPVWLPWVVMAFCPPAGLALMIVKIASQFTGIFDVMAYVGTGILLGAEAKLAQRQLDKADNHLMTLSAEERKKAEEAVQKWKKIKEELHPFKSKEGAVLAGYGMNLAAQAVATVVDVFVPGVGTAAKYAAYGLAAATTAGCYAKYRYDQAHMEMAEIPANVEDAAAV